ncbi:MAG: glucose-1-phosphate thymidylyltransferase [Nitrospinota bacterium]
MKAIVLCAGLGTRLYPLTLSMSKHLIPVANKPILFYALEMMRDAGINEIGLVIGESNKDIEDAVRDGSQWGLKVTYILQQNPKGLAHAAKVAQDFVGDESFVMYLGDNLLKEGLTGFVNSFNQNKPNALILLYHVDNPSQFGIAELNEGRIIRVVEKPADPPTDLAIVGAYLFDKNIFSAIDNIKPSKRNELEITDAIQYLIEKDYVVQPHIVKEWWKDTGRPEEILEANRFMLDNIEPGIKGNVDVNSKITGNVFIGEGTEIINSDICGPTAIGENCKIVDSFIGYYTSIGNNSLIKNSKVEQSVVMENGTMLHLRNRVSNSLFGRNVLLKSSQGKSAEYRFVLADHSFAKIH